MLAACLTAKIAADLDLVLETIRNMQPSPLHVTIGSTQELWHGGEKQAALLAEGLRRRGHRVTILARSGGRFAEGMSERSFQVAEFPGRGRSPKAIWTWRRRLQRWQPDVFFANDGHALTALGLSSFGLPIPLRIAARRVDFPVRSRAKFQFFSDAVVCVSSAVAEVCRQSGINADKLHVVHDGVPPSFAESGDRLRGRASLGVSPNTSLLLVVSKLTDHKGHRFLIDAMPELVRQHPDLQLALAGDGELREDLEKQTRALHLNDRVHFLGYRNDVPDLLAAADVVVQPSHLEGLCSSLIDAMFAARPIVATRAGGIPDLLDSSENQAPVAALVKPRSPEQLATAIDACLRDPQTANARAQAARVRALQQFTDDAMVEQTLEVLQSLWHGKFGEVSHGRAA